MVEVGGLLATLARASAAHTAVCLKPGRSKAHSVQSCGQNWYSSYCINNDCLPLTRHAMHKYSLYMHYVHLCVYK